MNITSFLIADNVYESQNRKVNIEGIFSQINVKSFPAMHKQLYVFLAFEGDDGQYDHVLTIKYGNNIVAEIHTPVSKKGGEGGNVVNRINNLPLSGPGEYAFEAKIGSEKVRQNIKVNKS